MVRDEFPDAQLHYFGRDWFFPNGDSYIEGLEKQYDASYFKNVTFHGNIPREKLMEAYAQCVVCVFPSHMDTQGLVCLEAMLMARPVVFTQYGPGPETIEDGVSGVLCDVYQHKAIAHAILRYLKEPTFAKQLGEKARSMVKEKYATNRILEQNLNFYRKLKQQE
ncbi:MAG: glycosyltransferase family 4 protein [Flavobacteriaceae bacterium]